MATIINNDPIRVLTTVDPLNGLDMYREINYFIGNMKKNEIIVSFNQWHESPTGRQRMNEKEMTYAVRDTEAVAEVLDTDGVTVLVPASPATTGFSDWAFKPVIQAYVDANLTIGEDIIIGTIKTELANLPFDFVSGSIV